MNELMCKGGCLDGKLISKPSYINKFKVLNLDNEKIENYIIEVEPDGFGGLIGNWILNNELDLTPTRIT